jgi:hypothetical protein
MENNIGGCIVTTPIEDNLTKINMITAAITASSVGVIRQARFYNTSIISWQDGKVVEIDPYSIEIEDDIKPKNGD